MPEPPPPPPLTKNAIRLRLRRVLSPNATGDFKVPVEVIKDFEGDNKERLYSLFEKSGYDKDMVGKHYFLKEIYIVGLNQESLQSVESRSVFGVKTGYT